MLSGIALSDVLDCKSNDGALLLLSAGVEASVGALAKGKRVVSLVNAWQISNTELLTEVTLELHGHLDGATAKAEFTKCLSVAVKEVDDTFADGIVGVAFETLGIKKTDAATDEALEVRKISVNQKIRSNAIF